MIDAESLRTKFILAGFLVAGIELGLAFLMRGEREASAEN